MEQARLAAVPEAQKAKVTMMRDVCASVAEQAKSVKIMQHTSDPQKVTQVYESMFNNSMLFQMMGGFDGSTSSTGANGQQQQHQQGTMNMNMGLCQPTGSMQHQHTGLSRA